MLKQTFTSEPFPYRLPAAIAGDGAYNSALITPPRIYGEEYNGGSPPMMFVLRETLVDGYESIYLWLSFVQVKYPGYGYALYKWNGTTGAYLGAIYPAGPSSPNIAAQGRDGMLYVLNSATFQVATAHIDPDQGVIFGDWFHDFSSFLAEVLSFNMDAPTDTLLTSDLTAQLHVWNISSGTKRLDVMLPAMPTQIMVIDATRCYVMTVLGLMALVDYTTGAVLSVLACQGNLNGFPAYGAGKGVTWDWIFQRLLVWTYTPVAADGQNTSLISGYFPRPLPVGITAPIALAPPRQYRKTPVYLRLYGDAGEPYPGGQVTLVASSPPPPPPATHRYWRLYLTSSRYGAYPTIDRLTMASTPGGANLLGAGTPSASGVVLGSLNGPVLGTSWTGSNSFPQWWAYDFGAGNAVDVHEVQMWPYASNVDYTPVNWQLQACDDGATWVTVESFTAATWTSAPQTFTIAPTSGGGASGAATVSGFPALTDADGESVATLTETGAGNLTLTATAIL